MSNKPRTLIISVNVTTDGDTEQILRGIRDYVSSMDEVGYVGETPDLVKLEQVDVITEEELSVPELIMWEARLNGVLPKCSRCGKSLERVEDMHALDGDVGCEECVGKQVLEDLDNQL